MACPLSKVHTSEAALGQQAPSTIACVCVCVWGVEGHLSVLQRRISGRAHLAIESVMMSVCMSLSVCLSVCLCLACWHLIRTMRGHHREAHCLSVRLSVCLSLSESKLCALVSYMPAYRSWLLSVCPSVGRPACRPVCPSVRLRPYCTCWPKTGT